MSWSYRDRTEAGFQLAHEMKRITFEKPLIVIAIPNGGVGVAVPIAESLKANLDLIFVRKIQIPWNPEAGFGAITSLGSVIINESLLARLFLTPEQIQTAIAKTKEQIKARQQVFLGLIGHLDPNDCDVILVDDGLASGFTMLAAIESVKAKNPHSITVAVPTASTQAVDRIKSIITQVICPRIERGSIFAVANAYQHWYDMPNSEVIDILQRFKA